MPRLARYLTVAALAALGGCGGGPAGPHPDALAYRVPDVDPLTYVFSDTARFSVETGGMGAMEVTAAHSGTAELRFRRAEDGELRVRLTVPRFDGTFEASSQGATSSDESGIGGAFELALTPTGGVTVVDTPSLGPAVRDVVGPESLVRPFFAHLPGRTVPPGESWVDTVTTVEASGGTVSRAHGVVTSTLAGDTTVEGRPLLLIRTETRTEITVEGESGGTEIRQRVSGWLEGHVLWDRAAGIVAERVEEGELSGTLELPATSAPAMPVRARLQRRVALRR